MDRLPASSAQVFATIGLLYVSAKIVSFVRLFLSLFVLPGTSLRSFGPKGSWAVVTGASDGIGAEYAQQLARHGFNILLVSRTPSKLSALAQQISTRHPGINTLTHAMDFSLNREADYAALGALADPLDVAILVNNVGQSHDMPVPFVLTAQKEMFDIITVNCIATLRVTRLIAPGMVQRRRGLILTMASFGGILPTPLLATYSGSKAFLQQWGAALGAELAPHGVRVQVVQSYLVTSAMSKIRRASALVPSARALVASALSSVGRSGGAQGVAYTGTPYWSHGVMHWALATVVGTMNEVVVGVNKRMHEGLRTRALRKKEREGKKET